MVLHICALSVHCEWGSIMVFGRKHFQAVSTDSQSLSRIEGLWVGLSRKWKTIPGRISLMKHDLWGSFYTLFISVPSTSFLHFHFTLFAERDKKKKWFLIQSGQLNEKKGDQDITNQGNRTGHAKTDVLNPTIVFGLNVMKEITTFSCSKQEKKQKRKKKSQSNTVTGQLLANKTEW